ncbi:MAG: DUF1559 domain-containing protein [Gemmataceae bacterium]|nr:DUF1559 domain-containing protein [Gemmataceae bacterium]
MKNQVLRTMRGRKGFTLIELLVVIAIIAVLIGLLVPAVQKVRDSAARSQCQNNLKQIGIALHGYHDVKKFFPNNARPSATSTVRERWVVKILPYLEQANLFKNYDNTQNWDAPVNLAYTSLPLPIFVCPSSPNPDRLDTNPDVVGGWASSKEIVSIGDYGALYGVHNTFVANNPAVTLSTNLEGILTKSGTVAIADVTDGTSNTIFVAESGGRPFLYRNGVKVNSNYKAAGVNGGGWCRPASDLWLIGTSKGGTAVGGPVTVNANNGFDHGGSYPLAVGTPALGPDPSGAIYAFHSGGANILLSDGSVRFLDEQIAPGTIAALVTRAGGETIPRY